MPPHAAAQLGKVYLVGAGPGDPGLITLRGVECLAEADLVLYDYLANPRLLEHAAAGAETICLGRHGRDRIMPQSQVNQRMIAAAQAGQTVVRLKSGDPAVFARAWEEIEALDEAGVPFEIVPGVTAALAAGSYAGVPITHRDRASAVALVTGQQQDGTDAALDYAALAQFPGTLVFYMGVTTAPVWSTALIEAGKSPDTPTAVIRRCSWPDQQVVRSTLGGVAEELARLKMRPPAIVVVGEVVSAAPTISWFMARPLVGKRVLVTRPLHQSAALMRRLENLGAEVLELPAIEITDPTDWQPVDEAMNRLSEYDWLVFSSANGVHWLLNRLWSSGGDARRLGNLKLAAIGPGTAEALAAWRLKPDLTPDEFRAEALAEALAPFAPGKRFLLARASRGREVLAEQLRAAGGVVDQIVVYQSRDATTVEPDIADLLAAGAIDWITVTSSAIARSLVALLGAELKKTRLASISPVTSATLRELGHEPAVEAAQYTMPGLVAAIVRGTRPEAPAR